MTKSHHPSNRAERLRLKQTHTPSHPKTSVIKIKKLTLQEKEAEDELREISQPS
jgi:hypothetical protein